MSLGQAVDPPSTDALRNAVEVLERISALAPNDTTLRPGARIHASSERRSAASSSETEVLTPLGRHLAFLPMDPQLGKALICGCLFRCLDPVLIIVASLR